MLSLSPPASSTVNHIYFGFNLRPDHQIKIVSFMPFKKKKNKVTVTANGAEGS